MVDDSERSHLRQALRSFKTDPHRMASLKKALADESSILSVAGLSNEQIVEKVVHLLKSNRVALSTFSPQSFPVSNGSPSNGGSAGGSASGAPKAKEPPPFPLSERKQRLEDIEARLAASGRQSSSAPA